MNKIDNQQKIAREILHSLEIIDPNCILAGGAPRNWFFNKLANDLDFYIYIPDETMFRTELRFKRLGLDVKHVDFTSEKWEDYGIMKHLFRIYEMEYKGEKVQIMIMREPTFNSVVYHFGVSICKFWWKGYDVVPTNEALISIINKTLYIKDDYSAKEIHVEKQKKYFPEYKVLPYSEFDVAESLTFEEYMDIGFSRGTISYTQRLLDLAKEIIKNEQD